MLVLNRRTRKGKCSPLGGMMEPFVLKSSPGFELVYKGASEATLSDSQTQAHQMTDAQLVSDDINVLLTCSSGAG